MAPIGKLFTYPTNPRAYKALIAAKYAGVELELPAFTFGTTNQTEQWKANFVNTAVPAFEGRNGEFIQESNAIATYVLSQTAAGAKLLGYSPLEKALIAQFVDMTAELQAGFGAWFYPIDGMVPYDAASVEAAKKKVEKWFTTFDKVLLNKTYLVGESVTLADIVFACATFKGFQTLYDAEFRKPFGNVVRYFLTLANQPEFKAVFGNVTLCEKALQYKPKEAGKETKKEEAKPKKAAEAEEEEEESYEEKPKEKNPLDLLPPSTFNLETWKRFYSNNEEAESIKYFWENLDRNGYSVYFADYKDNPIKGNKFFMTCNLVGGAFQRLESARKYAFGSYGIFGGDGENEIHGVWVFRGPEVPFEVKDSADFDSYEFTRADLDNQVHRERLNALFAWKEIPGVANFHGLSKLPFTEGKIFK